MKRKSLISLVCVAVLSQYGLAPMTALATENDKTVTGTASSEDLKTNTILDELPLSSENTEEATVESEDAAVESSEAAEATTESTTEESTEVEEAKTLNWEFKDPQQALIAGDDFTVKIKGTQATAKLELPEGIEYDAEKNVEELRPLISFDKETRELTLTKIDEYDEIELVLTVEKAGEYELQLKNEAQEDMGDKLKFAVAEKAEEVKEEKETEKKEEEPKKETTKEEKKKESKAKAKVGPQATAHSNVSLNLTSTPDDKITTSTTEITYSLVFGHNLSTDVLDDGKIEVTLTNGVFTKEPVKSANMKSLTMSYDKKKITIELKDNWGAGNLDSISFSVKPVVGIQKNDQITLNADFTGKFEKEANSFSNVAKKDVLFDAEGIKDVQPGTTDWKVSGWRSAEVYAGMETELIGFLNKVNESTSEGFSNLKIKVHISDASKLNWFTALLKKIGYKTNAGILKGESLDSNQVQKIDDQTYIITVGNVNPEDVKDVLAFPTVYPPEGTAPGTSVDVKAEYYNGDVEIFDVPKMTITVKDMETDFKFTYARDTQGRELAANQAFSTAIHLQGKSGKKIDDLIVETEVSEKVQVNKVVNGIMSSMPSLKKVEYSTDGVSWIEVPLVGDEFVFPNVNVKKIRYYYEETPNQPLAHQPIRTFYTVKSSVVAGDTFDLPNEVTFTDAKGASQVVQTNPATLDYDIVASKKEQTDKIATFKYLENGDFGTVSSGDKYTRSYRLAAVTGEIEQPYIFVKVPKGITVINKYNSIQYPYQDSYKTSYPLVGTPASPISKANTVGTFETADGDTVYYYKADDTKLSAADYLQMLMINHEYTIGNMLSGVYEVEVGMGSLTKDLTERELNTFKAENLSSEMQTKLGANISNYYSDKTKVVVGQGDRVNTSVSVKGSEDAAWLDANQGGVGTVTPGKKVSYKISMKNDGSQQYSDVELVNILPYVGDTLVGSSAPRNSQFQINPDSGGIKVLLNGVETTDITLQYSLSNDPTRFATPSGAAIGTDPWVSSVSDISQVRAVRASLPTMKFNPGDEITIEYSGVAVLDAQRPTNASESYIANNSVAYKFKTQADEVRVGEPAVSPVKTSIAEEDGLISGNVYIDLNKNGSKAGTEPGLNQVQFELFKKNGSGNFVTTGLTSESSSNLAGDKGIFGFTDLEYGTYKVKVTLPSSQGAEFVTVGTDGVDKINATTAWVQKNGVSEFTINDSTSTSHEITDLSVPMYVATPLNGTISFKNKDGNVVASNYGKGFKVELYDGSTKLAETTSKDNGVFAFDDLTISSTGSYKVKITMPSGKTFVFTTDNSAGEITIDMEPGVGTTDPTDLYITDTDMPLASIALDNGRGTGKDVNPDSVTLTASDKTTSISTDWKITKGGTTEYSGTSTDGLISLEDQINYLIGDKKAGDYTVEMTVTDFAGNQTTVSKNFSIKFANVKYMVGSTEYATESDLLLYVDKLTKPATDPTKAGYVFDKWVTVPGGTEWNFSTGAISEENLVLEATFKAAKQAIRFNVNGGDETTKPNDVEGMTGASISLSGVTAPTREGYTFKHWFKEGDAAKTDVGSSVTMPVGGMTLYADWKANSYEVIFNANDGTGSMADQTFTYDTAQNLTTNSFTRAGYSFKGWSTKKTGAYMYTDGASVKNLTADVDGKVTLYAIWEAEDQLLKFDFALGTDGPDSISAPTDSKVDLSAEKKPKRTGYTFKHWYKQGDAAKADVGSEVTMPAGGMTLVAEWEAISYEVKFHSNTGTGTMGTQSFKYDEIKTLTKNTFTKAGYTFVGWSTSANGASSYTDEASVSNLTAKAGTVDLYAVWSATAQVLQFDANGGTGKPNDITGDTDEVISLTGVTPPTRTGYTFKHWYVKDDAAKANVGSSVTMPAGGMILVAEWEANPYKVKFNANGGTETMSEQNFVYDTAQELTENKFQREGYSFAGWSTTETGAVSYVDKATVSNLTDQANAEVELFAVWTAEKQTIQFDVNGGDISTKPDDIDGDTDSNVDLSGVTAPEREGYTFKHWYKQGDAAKKPVNSTFKMPAGGLILVAEWSAHKYKVKFNVNGGTGTMKDQAFVYDAEQELTANAFERKNYDFAGWSTEKDGTVAYYDQDMVSNLTAKDGDTVVLYAIWEKKAALPVIKANNIVLTTKQVDDYAKANTLERKIAELADAKVVDENTSEVIATHEKVSIDHSNVVNQKGVYQAIVTHETKARALAEPKEIDVTVIDPTTTQKITFDVNGGDEKTKPADISAKVGTTVSLKDVKAPTRSGYSFTGWYNGETKVGDTVEMPDNGMTLVAHWSQDGGGNGSNGSGTNGGSNGSGTTNTNILARTGTTSTGKSLPQTNDTPTIGLSIVGGMLALLALFGFKKKKDEESETESK